MRCLVSAAFVSTLILPAVGRAQASQPSTSGDRLILSAGPGWTSRFIGGQLRAEYQLTPLPRFVAVRVHLGVFWTPAQSYSSPSALYGEGSTFEGVGQAAQLDLGVTNAITPWPRGRVSPYIVTGVAALQNWISGSGYYRRADGTSAAAMPVASGMRGDLGVVVGAGVRVRAGGRLLQLELRQLRGRLSTLGLGTALHF